MRKEYSAEIPQGLEYGVSVAILRYCVYELSDEEIRKVWIEDTFSSEEPDEWYVSQHKYGFYITEIPIGQWTREGIINAIIRDKYRIDEMEAITNNMAAINAVFMQTLVSDGIIAATKYLKESINDANTARFREMQEWRAMAKKVASEIIKE